MISVPSRPLPLSGSSVVVVFFCVLCSGCGLFKPVEKESVYRPNEDGTLDEIQGTKVYDPETGSWVTIPEGPKEKMDTIRWTNISETQMPPITSEGLNVPLPSDISDRAGTGRGTFDMVLMLPFLSNRLEERNGEIKNNVSRWSVNFYAGMQMALDQLDRDGLSLNLHVIDTEASPDRIRRLLESRADVRNAQIIMGPYRRDNIRMVAEFGKRENVIVVSPYSASSNLTADNPNFIQVSPTLESHCQALVQHALQDFDPAQIVLVARDADRELQCLDIMMEAYYTYAGTRDPEVIPEQYIVPHREAPYTDIDLEPLVEGRSDLAFVIPSWADETFVYSFLRELDVACESDQRVVVYGMPQWVNYQHIDYDYYERFNVRVSSNIHLDDRDQAVIDFKREYFERFGALPEDAAFLGYDLTRYFGQLLIDNGLGFLGVLDFSDRNMLHTRFDFEKITPTDFNVRGREQPRVDRYENKFVNILEFRDYRFERLNR